MMDVFLQFPPLRDVLVTIAAKEDLWRQTTMIEPGKWALRLAKELAKRENDYVYVWIMHDDETGVWYVDSSNVLGLAGANPEEECMSEIINKVTLLIPELAELNKHVWQTDDEATPSAQGGAL